MYDTIFTEFNNSSKKVDILTSLSFVQMLDSFYEKLIQQQNYNCPNCHKLLHFSLNSTNSFNILCLNCKDYETKTENILSFCNITTINQSLLNSIETKAFDFNSLLMLKKQFLVSLDYLYKWKCVVNNKTINILNEFNTDATIPCVNHNDCLSMFYCKSCELHLCDECKDDNEHIDHYQTDMIDLQGIMNDPELQKKIQLFPSAIQFQMSQNEKMFNKVKSLFHDRLNIMQVQSSFEQLNASKYDKMVKEYLLNFQIINTAYYNSILVLYCLDLLFHFNLKIIEILQMSNQYSLIAIKNVIELTKYETKDLTLMNLNYSQTQVSATTIATNLEKYLLTKSMFFPTNPEKPIFNEQTFYNVKNIKNINVTNIQNKLSREYGKHFVQIKHLLILDEKLIVIATSHSTIKVINLSSLKSVMKFKEHSSGVNYLCASNNKTFLSCGEDNLLIKWSYETLIPYKLKFIMKLTIKMNSKFKLKSHSGPVIQCLNLSDDREYFISVSKDKTFIIWNNSSKHPFLVSTSKTCLDGNIIAICIIDQFQLVSVSEDKKVIKWRINSDFKVERQVTANIEVGCSGVGSLKKINDNLVLIGNEEGINVLDVHTFTFVNKISGEGMDNIGGICCLSATTAIVGNLKYIFIVNLNYYGKDWEVKNKKEIKHLRQLNGIEILMDNHKNIITFGHDSTIKLWGYQIGV